MNCEICAKQAAVSIGGTPLCRSHAADMQIEIDRLRADNRAVNVGHIARRLWRAETAPVGAYLLREIPAELWAAARQRALTDGSSLRDLVLAALKKYVGGGK